MIIRYKVTEKESATGTVVFTGGDHFITDEGVMVPFSDVITRNGRGGARARAGRKSREELGLEPTKQVYGYIPESLYEKVQEKLNQGTLSMSGLIQTLLESYTNEG